MQNRKGCRAIDLCESILSSLVEMLQIKQNTGARLFSRRKDRLHNIQGQKRCSALVLLSQRHSKTEVEHEKKLTLRTAHATADLECWKREVTVRSRKLQVSTIIVANNAFKILFKSSPSSAQVPSQYVDGKEHQ